jgi:hypothetical protein
MIGFGGLFFAFHSLKIQKKSYLQFVGQNLRLKIFFFSKIN